MDLSPCGKICVDLVRSSSPEVCSLSPCWNRKAILGNRLKNLSISLPIRRSAFYFRHFITFIKLT